MRIRPTKLTPSEQQEVDDAVRDMLQRVLEEVPRILSHLQSPELRQLVYDLAFVPNEILPKRLSRPQHILPYLTDHTYLAYAGPDGPHRAGLVQLAILDVVMPKLSGRSTPSSS